jgi:hypothetical protein
MAKRTICAACGTVGRTKSETRGSFFIEVILWLCFLIPGLVYSIWRLTTRRTVCAECGGHALLPLTTPGGKDVAARFGVTV